MRISVLPGPNEPARGLALSIAAKSGRVIEIAERHWPKATPQQSNSWRRGRFTHDKFVIESTLDRSVF
jgi:hypothetical protein